MAFPLVIQENTLMKNKYAVVLFACLGIGCNNKKPAVLKNGDTMLITIARAVKHKIREAKKYVRKKTHTKMQMLKKAHKHNLCAFSFT
jgi:hypothetical protein